MINNLPPAPSRGDDPDVFVARADAWMAALPAFGAQANQLAVQFDAVAGIGRLGYLPPVPYSQGLTINIAIQTVEYAGNIYAPLLERLPFVTGADFDTTAWRVEQGVTASRLAASDGSAAIGHGDGTLESKLAIYDERSASLGQFDVILDGDSFLAPGGGNNWVDMFGSMSSFVGRGAIHNVAVPGAPSQAPGRPMRQRCVR